MIAVSKYNDKWKVKVTETWKIPFPLVDEVEPSETTKVINILLAHKFLFSSVRQGDYAFIEFNNSAVYFDSMPEARVMSAILLDLKEKYGNLTCEEK